MRVNVMEIGHLESTTVLLMVEEETLITVESYGTTFYRWKVQNAKEKTNQEYNAMLSIAGVFTEAPDADGFYSGMNTLGTAMVWANPVTFAHVVMDLINNQ